MSRRAQLSRRLALDSAQELTEWQHDVFLPNLPDSRCNTSPTIQVVGSKLMDFFLSRQAEEHGSIPASLLQPIELETRGIKVLRPVVFRKSGPGRINIGLMFEEPTEFVTQRRNLLGANGIPPQRAGFYNPLLHIATLTPDTFSLEGLAESAKTIPAKLEFLPLELEEIPQ